MKTFYMLYCDVNDGRLTKFATYEAALREAQIRINRDRGGPDIFILKAIKGVRLPVPDAEVEDLED